MTPQNFDDIYRSVLGTWSAQIPITPSVALQQGLPNPHISVEELRSMLVLLPLFSDGFPRQNSSVLLPRAAFLKSYLNLGSTIWPLPVPSLVTVLNALNTANEGPGIHPAYYGTVDRLLARLDQANIAGKARLSAVLLSHTPFTPQNFLDALDFLVLLPGVSLASAQHILSDIGWAVIKPDVHVVRVMFRLGGWGRNHFRTAQSKQVNLPLLPHNPVPGRRYRRSHLRALGFQQAYQNFFANLQAAAYPAPSPGLPSSSQLILRQVDRVLMLFTQRRRNGNLAQLIPICEATPSCGRCYVAHRPPPHCPFP